MSLESDLDLLQAALIHLTLQALMHSSVAKRT